MRKPTRKSKNNQEESKKSKYYLEDVDFSQKNEFLDLSDLKKFKPKSHKQKEFYQMIGDNILTICASPAGTGKTHCAVHKALELLLSQPEIYHKITFFNPAVEIGKSLGFLPGDINEKMAPYIEYTKEIMLSILQSKDVSYLSQSGMIEFKNIGFTRGHTFNNQIVVLSEAQNTTVMQMKTFVTRLGENVKVIIEGDTSQCDLRGEDANGLKDVLTRLDGLENVGFFEFTNEDVIRSNITKNILARY